jgi:mRNA-degrading endonuclease toxin of MazEF toxin-antitoxin module
MAKRSDVLVVRRRLGFGAEGRSEHFVIVQSDLLSGLDTVVVAPLDEDAPMYDGDPLAVHVSAKESGTRGPQVVLAHLLAAVSLEKFEPAVAGRLSAKSMVRVDEALRTAVQL